jgi:antitoxin (DNA-binding transcriptional repressor) of toxin-antitoxin stability system
MKEMNLRDANQQFSKLVREVEESGQTVIVLRKGKAVAQLGPVGNKPKRRMSAAQEAALNTLLDDARNSTANSRGAKWTRDDLHER